MTRLLPFMLLAACCTNATTSHVEYAPPGEFEHSVFDLVDDAWQAQGRPWNEHACSRRPLITTDPAGFAESCPEHTPRSQGGNILACYDTDNRRIVIDGEDDYDHLIVHEYIHFLCQCTKSCTRYANSAHGDSALWTVLKNTVYCRLGEEDACMFLWAGTVVLVTEEAENGTE